MAIGDIVTFHDMSGNPIGETIIERESWQRVPAQIAARLVVVTEASPCTPEKMAAGEWILLFRMTGAGEVEMWPGTAQDAWEKASEPLPQDLGAKLKLTVDAKVLHADGTWC